MQRTKIKPIEIYYLTITTWKSNFNLIQFISYNIMIQNITFYWYYRIHSLNSVSMDIYMIMQMRSLRSGHTVLGERHSPPQTACSARPRQPVAWNLAGSRKWANLTLPRTSGSTSRHLAHHYMRISHKTAPGRIQPGALGPYLGFWKMWEL